MADLSDLLKLDWDGIDLPEDFEPLDAIVLVKGVYQTDNGSLSRSVWAHRWTKAIAQNRAERIGALDIARRLAITEALDDYEAE